MKNQITKQLTMLNERYGWIAPFVLKNMRLLLLLLFAILSIYLVNRINTLVNEGTDEPVIITAESTDTTANPTTEQPTSSLTKKPDSEVLSVFNELTAQEVELESNFDNNRESPF